MCEYNCVAPCGEYVSVCPLIWIESISNVIYNITRLFAFYPDKTHAYTLTLTFGQTGNVLPFLFLLVSNLYLDLLHQFMFYSIGALYLLSDDHILTNLW